jgi:hypothetical protein
VRISDEGAVVAGTNIGQPTRGDTGCDGLYPPEAWLSRRGQTDVPLS